MLCGTLLPGSLDDNAALLAAVHHLACSLKTKKINKKIEFDANLVDKVYGVDQSKDVRSNERVLSSIGSPSNSKSRDLSSGSVVGIALVSPSFSLQHPAGQQMRLLLEAIQSISATNTRINDNNNCTNNDTVKEHGRGVRTPRSSSGNWSQRKIVVWCISFGLPPASTLSSSSSSSSSTKRVAVPSHLLLLPNVTLTGSENIEFPPNLCTGGVFHVDDSSADSEMFNSAANVGNHRRRSSSQTKVDHVLQLLLNFKVVHRQKSSVENVDLSSITRWHQLDVGILFRLLNVGVVFDVTGYTSGGGVYRMLSRAKKLYAGTSLIFSCGVLFLLFVKIILEYSFLLSVA